MRALAVSVTLVAALGLAGCGDTTASRSLSGGAIGAATGAALGVVTGGLSVATGAGIGGGIGLLSGLIYDQKEKGNIDF